MSTTTDISKYFRESLGIRDNESRLYLSFLCWFKYQLDCSQSSLAPCYKFYISKLTKVKYSSYFATHIIFLTIQKLSQIKEKDIPKGWIFVKYKWFLYWFMYQLDRASIDIYHHVDKTDF